MATFITLTTDRSSAVGAKIRVNADMMIGYGPADDAGREGWSWIEVNDQCGGVRYVMETPEQIDAMLGVTEPERQTVRWYRYDSAGRAAVFWEHNVSGFVLIPEGQTVAAGWWRYEHTDCDERGKFDLLHRAPRGE